MDATSHLWQRFARRLLPASTFRSGRFLSAAFVAVLLAGSLSAQTAGTGAIAGRVLNVGNDHYLANARVTVEGTKLEAITDDFGNYQILDVPAGEVKVTTVYTGLDVQTILVNVTAGQTLKLNVDLTSKERYGTPADGKEKVVQLDTFVVESQRLYEGDALSTNEQRYAPNIKVVVSSDSFGSVNEGNPGEFLKYLPGVTVDYVAADVRTVAVRGFASNFTNVYWDGMRMTSAASGTSNRVFEFEQVSINNTSRSEVTKVPTPDQPADSLGGNINFVSKSAFERKGAELNYRFYLNANSEDTEFKKTPGPGMESTLKVLPNFDFDYTLPVNDRFGIVITGLSSNQFVEQHRWQPTWNFAQAGATPTNPYLQQFQLQDGPKTTNRASLGIKADYKLSSTQVISLAVQDNYYKSYFGNRNLNFNMGTTAAPTPATGTPLQWGDGYVTSATGRGSVTQGSSFRDKYGNTLATKLNYTFKSGDWTVNGGASYAKSRSWYRALGEGHFSNIGTTLQGVSTVSAWGANGDPSPGLIWYARNAAGQQIDERNLDNYRLGTLRDDPLDGIATMTEGKVDVEKQFNLSFPFSVKAGVDVRQEVRDNRRYQNDYTYLGADGVANTADDNAAAYLDTSYANVDPYWGAAPIPWVDANKLGGMLVTNPSYFRLGTGTNQTGVEAETFRINNSERIQERVSAAYLEAQGRFINNKLNVVAGVRFEKTNDEGAGVLSNPDAVWQTNSDGTYVDGSPTTPGVQRVRRTDAGAVGSLQELTLIRVERGATANRSYDGYYPGIHLTYNITNELLARFSYAKTIGRPDYANIIPNTDINYDDSDSSTGFITIRNTELKPWTADNFDFSLEYYFKKGGLISAGVFQKNIADFWAVQGGTVDAALADQLGLPSSFIGWGVSTTVNGGDARIQGGEINWVQPLSFLPGWGRYFTLKANGTTLDLSGDNTADFRGFIDKTGNFSVAFNKKPFALNVTFNFRGRQIGTVATAPAAQTGAQYDVAGLPTRGFTEYYAPRTYIDVNGEVKLSKHVSLFAGVRNLLNKPQIIQRYNADSPSYSHTYRQEEFGVSCSLGIKGTF
ncbi:MAG: TonB-dependent receptor [Lacunisphaera sp.]